MAAWRRDVGKEGIRLNGKDKTDLEVWDTAYKVLINKI